MSKQIPVAFESLNPEQLKALLDSTSQFRIAGHRVREADERLTEARVGIADVIIANHINDFNVLSQIAHELGWSVYYLKAIVRERRMLLSANKSGV